MTALTRTARYDVREGIDFLFLQENGQIISPWHDVPLFADGQKEEVNMVVEIPRKSHAKMEISKDDHHNPIKQDVFKGNPRVIADVPPFQGYPCNYGALPQTWESPYLVDPTTRVRGDDDPLDICEIGSEVALSGEVMQVKPFCAFAVLDEGETDWKVIAININDPLAPKLSDIQEVEALLPGYLGCLMMWYKRCKLWAGKPENTIAHEGRLEDCRFAVDLMRRCHMEWKQTRKGHPSRDGRTCSTIDAIP